MSFVMETACDLTQDELENCFCGICNLIEDNKGKDMTICVDCFDTGWVADATDWLENCVLQWSDSRDAYALIKAHAFDQLKPIDGEEELFQDLIEQYKLALKVEELTGEKVCFFNEDSAGQFWFVDESQNFHGFFEGPRPWLQPSYLEPEERSKRFIKWKLVETNCENIIDWVKSQN